MRVSSLQTQYSKLTQVDVNDDSKPLIVRQKDSSRSPDTVTHCSSSQGLHSLSTDIESLITPKVEPAIPPNELQQIILQAAPIVVGITANTLVISKTVTPQSGLIMFLATSSSLVIKKGCEEIYEHGLYTSMQNTPQYWATGLRVSSADTHLFYNKAPLLIGTQTASSIFRAGSIYNAWSKQNHIELAKQTTHLLAEGMAILTHFMESAAPIATTLQYISGTILLYDGVSALSKKILPELQENILAHPTSIITAALTNPSTIPFFSSFFQS